MGVRRSRGECGQATVELAVVLPIAIIVAVVVVNALSFLGSCAEFDRMTRQTVCAWGASPEAGQDASSVSAAVQDELERVMGAPNITIAVRAEGSGAGLVRFTARLEYMPTLFGLGLRREIFGIALPPLSHEVSMAVDVYKPGILF